jgi:hypothetical protein
MVRELSAKLREVRPGLYQHWCPGCKTRHEISVGHTNASGAAWSFNGDALAPTFSPSVHISVGPWDDDRGHHPVKTVCHYFITHGRISFCGDSAHALAGKDVVLPDFPPWAQP